MEMELRPRTEQEVRIYFARTRDPEIQARIPQRSQTVEQALEDYRRSLAPGADSYGRTVWADGVYVGDVWCYCIHAEPDPDAMVSYCIVPGGCRAPVRPETGGGFCVRRQPRLGAGAGKERLCHPGNV